MKVTGRDDGKGGTGKKEEKATQKFSMVCFA